MARSNPNGANAVVTDPRQALFLKYYLDPNSSTFSNAKRSAIRAKYTEQYADIILATLPDWLSDALRRRNMAGKAERNLEEMLDVDVNEIAMGAFGPIVDKKTKKPYMHRNTKVMGLKLDASKFVAERLNKKDYGKDDGKVGDTYNTIILADDKRARKIAERIIARTEATGNVGGEEASN